MSVTVRRWLSIVLLTGGISFAGRAHAEDSGFFGYLFEDLTWPSGTPSLESLGWTETAGTTNRWSAWDFVIADIHWPDTPIAPGASFSLSLE
jgi:hypothetical protein